MAIHRRISAGCSWKFSSKEVMAVATIHLWDMNEKLDWIEENNIDGLSFQGLNDLILQGFGVEYVEDRKRILNLKQKFKTVSEPAFEPASEPAIKFPGTEMLKIFGVSFVVAT